MSKFASGLFIVCLAVTGTGGPLMLEASAAGTVETTAGDRMFAAYFKTEADKISDARLFEIHSLAEWQAHRHELQKEAAEMLGLDPFPDRTALNPVITGKIEGDSFFVEKLYFQSRPHLYVTANLYVPKHLTAPAPAVLYLCGHTPVITNGISYGNKTAYQHHGAWFAQHGYVCLVLDTLQWGEIRGQHRGTYSEGMWWWNSRGYTPAAVETWNAICGVDYLVTRPEVDGTRIGVTGRSGGGAYSWFVTALDDRIKVAAPVAGITDLRNYVVDGTVDDHCDCMFFVNTYRWDYPTLAALCAPRPLLLANTDADSLFPLDGVLRTHNYVKKVYDLYGAGTNFGLVIGPGPHKDTQDMQVPVFRWFGIHLQHEDPIINSAALKLFSPGELKVFDKIPEDQINTEIQESFVPMARTPEVPATAQAWQEMKDNWMRCLREKCFGGWPADFSPRPATTLFSEESAGVRYEVCEIQSQPEVALRIYLVRKTGHSKPHEIYLHVADSSSFTNSVSEIFDERATTISQAKGVFGMADVLDRLVTDVKHRNVAYAVFLPRGIGPTAWSGGATHGTQIRRRFMLLGQTLDGMRVWDIRRAVQALHSMKDFGEASFELKARGEMGVNALYAAIFEPNVDALDLGHLPASHIEGPDYLNVLKYLDIPEAAAMAAEQRESRLQFNQTNNLNFLRAMAASPVAHLKLELK